MHINIKRKNAGAPFHTCSFSSVCAFSRVHMVKLSSTQHYITPWSNHTRYTHHGPKIPHFEQFPLNAAFLRQSADLFFEYTNVPTKAVCILRPPCPNIYFLPRDVGEKVRFCDHQWSSFCPFPKVFSWFPNPYFEWFCGHSLYTLICKRRNRK